MTTHPLAHDGVARAWLRHPMCSALCQAILDHSGPWSAEEADRLNALKFELLHFESKNGQLHVRRR